MKLRYERPVFVRHSLAGVNKFGVRPAVRPIAAIDGVRVADLVAAYGSPLFVFSERTLRDRVRELRAALSRRLANFELAWSYKTNYLSAICKVFHQEGSLAEVVSGMELNMALGAGVAGKQILFNGPYKTESDLALAFRQGVHIHIDHLDELACAEKVAERLGVRPEVGMRVNLSELPVPARMRRCCFRVAFLQACVWPPQLPRGPRSSCSRCWHCCWPRSRQCSSAWAQKPCGTVGRAAWPCSQPLPCPRLPPRVDRPSCSSRWALSSRCSSSPPFR